MSKENLLSHIRSQNLGGVLSELEKLDASKLTEKVGIFRPSCLLESIRLGYDTFKKAEKDNIDFSSQETAINLAIMLSIINKAGRYIAIEFINTNL